MELRTSLFFSLKIAALALFLSACTVEGDEDDSPKNVVWTCTCSWVRDGTPESSEVGGGCGDQEDAQRVANEAITQCQSELDLVCTSTCEPCACQCNPGNQECTPG